MTKAPDPKSLVGAPPQLNCLLGAVPARSETTPEAHRLRDALKPVGGSRVEFEVNSARERLRRMTVAFFAVTVHGAMSQEA